MFVNRDSNNKIIAAYANQQTDNQEWLDDDNAELQAFLNPPTVINTNLLQAYNAFITYARSLNLEDKATMQDFQTLALQQETEALTNSDLPALANAIKIPLMALGLINDISQAGGNWNGIVWTDNIGAST